LFAWSWSGHGSLTAIGVAFAILRLITEGKTTILGRLAGLTSEVWRYDDEGGPDTTREAEITKTVSDSVGSMPGDAAQVASLFSDLPTRVQVEDIHAGNIPWGVGETLDPLNGQVRHFMRSSPAVTPEQAYLASFAYIKENCVITWTHLKAALNPGTGWGDKIHDFFLVPNAVGDANQGKRFLAKALHTVEDSFAPGHVKRILGTIIEEVHIWDDENKNPHGDWPGHEALDNPDHPMSKPFFEVAKRATGDFIYCILANLDQNEFDFRTALDTVMFTYLARGSLAPDTPLSPPQSIPA
jgi:hypothetical protein